MVYIRCIDIQKCLIYWRLFNNFRNTNNKITHYIYPLGQRQTKFVNFSWSNIKMLLKSHLIILAKEEVRGCAIHLQKVLQNRIAPIAIQHKSTLLYLLYACILIKLCAYILYSNIKHSYPGIHYIHIKLFAFRCIRHHRSTGVFCSSQRRVW